MVDKEDIFERVSEALTDAHTLATINGDSETMLAVAGWWVELFDRAVAIEVMERDGKKAPIGFTYAIGEHSDEHEHDED